jgi:3-oxoacyl-[acyl-carrier-protein] synthase II
MHPDPNCDLDSVPQTTREFPFKTAVSTSFSCGGQNGALVMRQFCG